MAGIDSSAIEALVRFVQYGECESVRACIVDKGVPVSVVDHGQCGLLHWAAINNRLEIAKLLVGLGASVNATGGDLLEIPLQWALRNENHTYMVEYLIDQGSSLAHKNTFGHDSLSIACQLGHVHLAFLLLVKGANPNSVDNNGNTALHLILKNENPDFIDAKYKLVRLLLRFGVDVSILNDAGDNCMHILAAGSREFDLGIALYLCEKGEEAKILKTKNKEGKTPFNISNSNKNLNMLRFLYDYHHFKSLPYDLPSALTAIAMASVPLMLSRFGLWLGLLGAVCVGMMTGVYSQMAIIRESSRLGFGWACGVIISVVSAHYWHTADVVSRTASITFYVLAALTTATIFLSRLVKPATLAIDDDRLELYRKVVLTGVPEGVSAEPRPTQPGSQFRLCCSCLADRSLASTHCTKCDRCVIALDHHCDFVSNCVGRGNRRLFVVFTLCASLGCGLGAVLGWWAMHHHYCRDSTGMVWNFFAVQGCAWYLVPDYVWSMYVSLFASVWIGCIAVSQIGLVSVETTTFDVMKGHHSGRPDDGCSCRNIRNVVTFFRSGVYSVVKQQRKSFPMHKCGSESCQHDRAISPGRNSGSEMVSLLRHDSEVEDQSHQSKQSV